MPPAKQTRSRAPEPSLPEVVDPRWILKALGAVIALGLLCAYITLCLFFYAGQWQFVLHPSRKVNVLPSSQKLSFEDVRFGDDIAGQPQLAGWWMPSDSPNDPTVLMLHSESGSRSDALPAARMLHDARLNVLLFDYRGYGDSAGRHPSERLMTADSEQALHYLTSTRGISEAKVLVYGRGLGASLATSLCAHHPALPGLVLLDADGDTASRVEADQRSRIIPVSMLFHERFPLADKLHVLKTPKLLISTTRGSAPEIAQRAADPKLTVEVPGADQTAITAAIRRFLDTYIAHPAPTL